MAAPATPPESDLTRAYLAERDVACPRCGYNLRGGDGAACPECGEPLRLILARRAQHRGYLLFLLLAFGWVALAGLMNGYRQGALAYGILTAPPLQSLNTVVAAQSITFSLSGAASSPITVRIQDRAGAQQFTMANGQLMPITPAPASWNSPNWSAVPAETWAALGWWAALAAGGLGGLFALLALRRRIREAPPRRLTAIASALFAVYAGFHIVAFVRELI